MRSHDQRGVTMLFAALILLAGYVASCSDPRPPATRQLFERTASKLEGPTVPSGRELDLLDSYVGALEKALEQGRAENLALARRVVAELSGRKPAERRTALLGHTGAILRSISRAKEAAFSVFEAFDQLESQLRDLELPRRVADKGIAPPDPAYNSYHERLCAALLRLDSIVAVLTTAGIEFERLQSRTYFDLTNTLPLDLTLEAYPMTIDKALLFVSPEQRVEAMVMSIEHASSLLVLDKGEDHGVAIGNVFQISGKGKVRVRELQGTTCVAEFLAGVRDVVPGDSASSW